jgi:hypothetical protein
MLANKNNINKARMFGDKVDRILSHRISTDRKIMLNSRKAKESFIEIRKYNNNISRNLENATDGRI